MTRIDKLPALLRNRMGEGLALAYLLLLAGMALVGPSGVLAWGDNLSKIDQHHQQIAQLAKERDVLKNRVELLDPNKADPDMVGELLRQYLNVAHPDEVVVELK